MAPGEIYWSWTPDDTRHRMIVVSRESLNRGTYCIVVPITSSDFETRRHLANCVPFRVGEYSSITQNCVAVAEQITFIEIEDIDLENGPIDLLAPAKFRELVRAIGYVMESECEPQ